MWWAPRHLLTKYWRAAQVSCGFYESQRHETMLKGSKRTKVDRSDDVKAVAAWLVKNLRTVCWRLTFMLAAEEKVPGTTYFVNDLANFTMWYAGMSTRWRAYWLSMACGTTTEGRIRRAAAGKLMAEHAKAEEEAAESWWYTNHFDNYCHSYWHKSLRLTSTGTDMSSGNWTAHGVTYTAVPAASMFFGSQEPQATLPPSGNFLDLPHLVEDELRAIDRLLLGPSALHHYRLSSPAAEAKDYGHPLGCRHKPDSWRKKLVPGTTYRPTHLAPDNCSSSCGLVASVARIVDEDRDDRSYRLYRIDINLYWRLMKAQARASSAPFNTCLRHVCFFLSPWHTMKQLAQEIWHTISPGDTLSSARHNI